MAEPFDMSLVQRGARNRRTPYYEATQRYGPKGYTVYNHMYFPIRFDTFENEFETAAERRHALGRRGRAVPGDQRPRRVRVRAAAHAARPLEVRGRPGEVRPDLRQRRRDHQRPRADPDGREHVLVRARVLRRAAVRARAEERLPGPGRDDQGGRRRAAAGAGAEVEGPHGQAARREHPGPQVLLLDARRDRRRAGRRHPHRLDVRGRLRGLHDRDLEGERRLRGAHEGRRGVQHQAHRPERHPPDRGRHLQLGRRHDVREQPDRDGPRPPGRLGHADRTTRASRSRR